MIVMDTNVVSELMRPSPNPAVETWIANRPAASPFFSAVGEAELCFGLAIMSAGRPGTPLRRKSRRCYVTTSPIILLFDSDAVRAYAAIVAGRRATGRSVAGGDCQIAAITGSRGPERAGFLGYGDPTY